MEYDETVTFPIVTYIPGSGLAVFTTARLAIQLPTPPKNFRLGSDIEMIP